MKARLTIKPIARIESLSERALKAVGFRFTRVLLLKDSHNLLQLHVDWTADHWGAKYPARDGTGSSMCWHQHSETVELSFPPIIAPYCVGPGQAFQPCHHAESHVAHIEVGITISRDPRKHKRARKGIELGYSYAYHQNTKWGVAVYYKPEGWWEGRDKCLFEWRARR